MKIVLRVVQLSIFITGSLLIVGCGQGNPSGTVVLENKNEWEPGKGELSNTIGEYDAGSNGNDVVSDGIATDEHTSRENEELWELTEYEKPTGTWFLYNGEGLFGYGLTAGTQTAGGEYVVQLFGHHDAGDRVNRDVRIQLSERGSSLEKEKLIEEEVVYLGTVGGLKEVYTGILPDKENVSYLLSAEILNNKGEVEDTRVTLIYVPKQEMNVRLKTEQDVYAESDSEATLILENDGPTNLFFGTYYTIEKKVNDSWKVVPIREEFQDIGIILSVGEQYEQTLKISGLNKGKYRVIKEIGAEGLALESVLAAEFRIE